MVIASILITHAKGLGDVDVHAQMEQYGLVDVQSLDSTIVVHLMYAQSDNFVGQVMYTNLTRAYLHPKAAEAICKASQALHHKHPDYNIKICDASRPMSVQRLMYSKVRNTSKRMYVSNPANGGGMHNYGMAVDVTIVDESGKELPMGTKVDHLGPEANIDNEDALVATGKISLEEKKNRELLREVMKAGGFKPLRSEWWHFNMCSRATAKRYYKLLDF